MCQFVPQHYRPFRSGQAAKVSVGITMAGRKMPISMGLPPPGTSTNSGEPS